MTVVLKPEGEYRKSNPKDCIKSFVSHSWPLETDFLGIPYNKVERYINVVILHFFKSECTSNSYKEICNISEVVLQISRDSSWTLSY